jgi:hypothetical protein
MSLSQEIAKPKKRANERHLDVYCQQFMHLQNFLKQISKSHSGSTQISPKSDPTLSAQMSNVNAPNDVVWFGHDLRRCASSRVTATSRFFCQLLALEDRTQTLAASAPSGKYQVLSILRVDADNVPLSSSTTITRSRHIVPVNSSGHQGFVYLRPSISFF